MSQSFPGCNIHRFGDIQIVSYQFFLLPPLLVSFCTVHIVPCPDTVRSSYLYLLSIYGALICSTRTGAPSMCLILRMRKVVTSHTWRSLKYCMIPYRVVWIISSKDGLSSHLSPGPSAILVSDRLYQPRK